MCIFPPNQPFNHLHFPAQLVQRIAITKPPFAGMPLISDPGASLVRRVAQQGVAIFPIPGPSAPLAALVASGLATERFQFCGFLPPKQGARMEAIKSLKGALSRPHSQDAAILVCCRCFKTATPYEQGAVILHVSHVMYV